MAFVLTKAKKIYTDLRGFHTDRHIVVIESDDWGSIRMPSQDTFLELQSLGDHPENDAFLTHDCLENDADLNALFEVLTSVKDSKGSPAVMTANFATANPDFARIDFENGIYAYEPFYETYDRYYPGNDILGTIRNGMDSGCFHPQLHCREHMNVSRWMSDLKAHKTDALTAFEHRMIGIGASFSPDNRFGYMDAFNTNFSNAKELEEVISDAASIFEETFGFKSLTFVASCFVWDDDLERSLCKLGVNGIQSGGWQNVPTREQGNVLKRRLRFTGQKNRQGQIYTIRNCEYEPAYHQNAAEMSEKCFDQIMNSFNERKPAVINSHRFNYIGSIDPDNADRNLQGLSDLICRIVNKVPDVEFMSTPDLVEIINREK